MAKFEKLLKFDDIEKNLQQGSRSTGWKSSFSKSAK
jgi:hypothetical protein